MTAREALLEVLRTEGVRHLFGNPGSTELPLIDALASADDLRYVLALQEASAVGIAEGYAMASGRPAFILPRGVWNSGSRASRSIWTLKKSRAAWIRSMKAGPPCVRM